MFAAYGRNVWFFMFFQTRENHFTEGLYLAGVEAADEAETPAGWVKWTGIYVFPNSEVINGKLGYGVDTDR